MPKDKQPNDLVNFFELLLKVDMRVNPKRYKKVRK